MFIYGLICLQCVPVKGHVFSSAQMKILKCPGITGKFFVISLESRVVGNYKFHNASKTLNLKNIGVL